MCVTQLLYAMIMTHAKNILLLGFLWMSNNCFAQESAIDSLNLLIEQSENDTTKVQLMLDLSKEFFGSDPNKAISISEQARALSEFINYNSGVAYSFKNIGLGYYYLSDYVQAIAYFKKANSMYEEINDDVGSSMTLSNMGAIYADQGDYVKGSDLLLQSLKIAEESKDTLRIAFALHNIGVVHEDNHEYDLALNFYRRALPLFESMNNDDLAMER